MMIQDNLKEKFKLFLTTTILLCVLYVFVSVQFPYFNSMLNGLFKLLYIMVSEPLKLMIRVIFSMSNYRIILLIAGIGYFLKTLYHILSKYRM